MAIRRIKKELKDLKSDPSPNYIAGPVADDMFKWNATIYGVPNSPYANGVFVLDITFPSDYPFKTPRVKFMTKIFHPQIDGQNGTMCISPLGNNWSPALTISKVLFCIYNMLSEPFSVCSLCRCCNDIIDKNEARQRALKGQGEALTNKAWMLYFKDKPKYEQTAREWTSQYATNNPNDNIITSDFIQMQSLNINLANSQNTENILKETISGQQYSMYQIQKEFKVLKQEFTQHQNDQIKNNMKNNIKNNMKKKPKNISHNNVKKLNKFKLVNNNIWNAYIKQYGVPPKTQLNY